MTAETNDNVSLQIAYPQALLAASSINRLAAITAANAQHMGVVLDIGVASKMAADLIEHAMKMDRPEKPTKDELIAEFVKQAKKLGKPRKRRQSSKRKAAKRGNAAAA
jgi:hypothetical protein